MPRAAVEEREMRLPEPPVSRGHPLVHSSATVLSTERWDWDDPVQR
ncbi:hypothetical protein ACP70R_040616 [Stipagrostis hirtigluma subsp. patula]